MEPTPLQGKTIVLAVINARYSHAALGARCLLANMGGLRDETVMEEFVIQDHPQRIAERLLAHHPRIIGFSLAIWNVSVAVRTMAVIKVLEPSVSIVVGGPEVRWADAPPEHSDVLVRGEGEAAFPDVCRRLIAGEEIPPVIDAPELPLDTVALPYAEYSDTDLKQRIISVEASRGCPFGCEFCLSSRDGSVRSISLDRLLPELDRLIERGCRGFKFIDRTFNLNLAACRRLLDFFHDRWPRSIDGTLLPPRVSRQVGQGSDRGESFFLHFEVVPDRFDEALVESLARFPAGGIQLEMGIQTLDPDVGARIGRKVDASAAARSLDVLRRRTGAHIHADLIMGLPGEDVGGIARSFDALRAMGPHEIQMGVLKLLPGAPIARHAEKYAMVFNPEPPYDVLQTDRIGFERMQRLKILARYYDLFANSGKFIDSMNILMGRPGPDGGLSAFREFDRFTEWVWRLTGQDHAMSQARQYELALGFLSGPAGLDSDQAGCTLAGDYLRIGRERHMPEVLRPFARG